MKKKWWEIPDCMQTSGSDKILVEWVIKYMTSIIEK